MTPRKLFNQYKKWVVSSNKWFDDNLRVYYAAKYLQDHFWHKLDNRTQAYLAESELGFDNLYLNFELDMAHREMGVIESLLNQLESEEDQKKLHKLLIQFHQENDKNPSERIIAWDSMYNFTRSIEKAILQDDDSSKNSQ